MSFKNYYNRLNSQTGIKAYIKKRVFNNLLKELIKQEDDFTKQKKELERQKDTFKAQAKKLKEWELALKKQERVINTITHRTVFEKWKPVKIVQFTPGLWCGDAVSDVIVAFHQYLISKGYDAEIYAKDFDPRLVNDRYKSCDDLPELLPDDILICHFSIESGIMEKILRNNRCRKIMFYHNITPAGYFKEYNPGLAELCERGRQQLRKLKDVFEYCLTVSEYNRRDLRREGYTCPIGILPILIPFEKYNQLPDSTVLEKYGGDGITNVLFVGRVVPHKKQEDVIAAFAYYHNHINPRSRLFIVGNTDMGKGYCTLLQNLVKENGLEEAVRITDMIPFSQLLAYYRLADVFLCMSEHEGFCVPVVEAMLFSVPVVAYRAAAVPETIGDAGIIVDTKEPAVVAKAIDRAVNDKALRRMLQYLMQKRLEDFAYEKTTGKFDVYLNAVLERRNIEKALPVSGQTTTGELLSRETPALLIDMTQITVTGNWGTGLPRSNDKIWMTGIQRVVNNLFHQMYNQAENVIPLQYKSGRFITSNAYLSWMEGVGKKADQTVALQQGDRLLLLDDPWNKFSEYAGILDMAAETGVQSYAIVHDLIPVQYPEVCQIEKVIREYAGWHNMILQKADAIVCVSQTTADVLVEYYKQMRFVRSRPLSVYYFHLGADVPEGEESVRDEIRSFVEGGKYTFLMVGTVEVRKGHMVALQALQKLPDDIRRGCRLLIIGKNGWKNDDVRKMVDTPEFKENVLWIRNASDEELRWAYAHTDALIAASLQEGFGLPLVEAAHFGLPLICSDIPVFREVTQENADYFTVMDPDALAACLVRWTQTERHPDSRNIRIYSWQESAREFLDIMEGKTKPYKVVQ